MSARLAAPRTGTARQPWRLGRWIEAGWRHARACSWYPALLAPLPVVHLYAVSVASAFAVGRAFLIAALGGLLIVIVVNLVVPERARAGVAASVLIAALAFVGSPIASLAAVFIVLFARMASANRTTGRDRAWRLGDLACRAATAGLSLAVIFEVLAGGGAGRFVDDLANEGPWRPSPGTVTVDPRAVDIFIDILDGYPRADVLADKTGADNTAFTASLTSIGFDVASRSRASYPLTGLTLASLLNMRHLADIPGVRAAAEDPARFSAALRDALDHAEGPRILRSLGYEFVTVSPGYEPTALRRADRFLDSTAPNEFELVALTTSGLGVVLEALNPDLIDDAYRARLRDTLALLNAEVDRAGDRPRFVLAHLPAPHPPFAYGADGEPVPIDWSAKPISRFTYSRDRAAKVAAFADYVGWTNGAILPVIERLVARHPEAVVIVMSDHGSDTDFNWRAITAETATERLANLMAARVPGEGALYGEAPTTVNVLTTLLNRLFDLGIPVASDHSVLQTLEDPARSLVYPAPTDAPEPHRP